MKGRPRTKGALLAQFDGKLNPSDEYARGYLDGFSDGVNTPDQNEPVMAWAVVDREREKVRFETVKPEMLGVNDVLIPLYVRPEGTKQYGEGAR